VSDLSLPTLRRRDLLKSGALAAGALAFGPAFWRDAFASPATAGPGPYGPLQPANLHGIELPAGFKSRRIAQGLLPVLGTTYVWHLFSDGQATFATDDGGFILVSNSEVPEQLPGRGGASAIRFDAGGKIVDAYRILSGTSTNCAGGGTPWGTWMSCEEHDEGLVWECDPWGAKTAIAHPAMGVFSHEALCVDPVGKQLYLSEDDGEGRLYRFTPTSYPDCSSGLLEVATVAPDRSVSWTEVPDPTAATTPTRQQVPGSTAFRRGEGIWFDSGIVYLATTSDNKVHAYDTTTQTIDLVYDGGSMANPPFVQVDNVTVSRSGDLFVCEDPGEIGMGIITPEGEAARFLRVSGPGQVNPVAATEDVQSEITGVIFDPSGTRMFFSAQRSFLVGVIYEITGPFRLERPAVA
jgi:secreted PhoX family phosphatase